MATNATLLGVLSVTGIAVADVVRRGELEARAPPLLVFTLLQALDLQTRG